MTQLAELLTDPIRKDDNFQLLEDYAPSWVRHEHKKQVKGFLKDLFCRRMLMPWLTRNPKENWSIQEAIAPIFAAKTIAQRYYENQGIKVMDSITSVLLRYIDEARSSYFIDQTLLDALDKTSMDSVNLSMLKFPIHSGLFVFPKGIKSITGNKLGDPTHHHVKTEYITGIMFARNFDILCEKMLVNAKLEWEKLDIKQGEPDRLFDANANKLLQNLEVDSYEWKQAVKEIQKGYTYPISISPSLNIAISYSSGQASSSNFYIKDATFSEIKALSKEAHITTVGSQQDMLNDPSASMALGQNGQIFTSKAIDSDDMHRETELLVKLVLYMSARKREYTTIDKILSPFPREKKIAGVNKSMVLAPKVLTMKPDKKYPKRSEKSDKEPTGRRQKWHIRPGRFSQIRYGKQWCKVRTQWIQPHEAGDPDLL